VLEGDVPSPRRPPAGCRFHTRCPAVVERCRSEPPPSVTLAPGHSVHCVHADALEPGVDGYPRMLARVESAEAANRARSVAPVEPGIARTARMSARPAVRGATACRRRLGAPFAFALLAVIALSVFGGRALEARADRREAEAQLSALALEIERASAIRGGYPTSLDALGWRLVPIFGDARAVDPWGRAWHYRPPDAAGASFALGSLGPDGAPDTGDEIGRLPPEK
jgi:hypothetical protein